MKKVIIEFCREEDGTRQFTVYRTGEKKQAKRFQSQYQAFAYMGTLYASQPDAVGCARAA